MGQNEQQKSFIGKLDISGLSRKEHVMFWGKAILEARKKGCYLAVFEIPKDGILAFTPRGARKVEKFISEMNQKYNI
jgi:hypothetical protein